jgi:pyruvate formate lyase activating enzyme
VAVTAGYICEEPRREFFRFIDAANVDLKAFREQTYYRVSGGHLQDVLDTLVYLKRETDVWFEITTLLIPDLNDSNAELEAECQWIADNLGTDVPLHFSAFHPDYKMRDRPPTPVATLRRARTIAMNCGIRYVYTGNVHDPGGQSTFCHNCGTKLIGRDGYELGAWALTPKGDCQKCGARCAGVFDNSPADWGSRRLPVRLRKNSFCPR